MLHAFALNNHNKDNLMPVKLLFYLILLLTIPVQAFAKDEVLAICENPSGYRYDSGRGVFSPQKSAWGKDAISDSTIVLIVNDEGAFDIRTLDATKSVHSHAEAGALSVPVYTGVDVFLLSLINPRGFVGTYAFEKSPNNEYQLLYTENTVGGAFFSVKAWQAKCTHIDFPLITSSISKE